MNSNLIQNTESACVSMPDQVVQQNDAYVWKVNLKKTEPYWEGLFLRLSLFCRLVQGNGQSVFDCSWIQVIGSCKKRHARHAHDDCSYAGYISP